VTPPAPPRQQPQQPPPNQSFGAWLCAWLLACGVVLFAPAQALAAIGTVESIPLVVIVVGLALALSFLGAVAAAVTTLLRRSRDAANEARRLNALLDMLDEGVAVCSGMQAVAVNTSLCRLIGIAQDDAAHLMISSFLGDADVIDRLLDQHLQPQPKPVECCR